MTKPQATSNIPEFSVSELAFALKKTVEDNFAYVRVRGELGRVTRAASGHVYATLKDDSANIDAVCWKGTVAKLSVKPEEGLEVVCTGRLTTYPASSKYQIVIDSMELAGAGALLKMLEERRKKLAAEGLFEASRKKEIPFLPEVIGVVTSPTGAVIRDILHRLEDRFPRHVLVWPVLVQGAGAAEQIAAAINGFQTIHQHGMPKPDLIIVARGGGSLEDLMAFNEEIVVRAAAASTIPLISAVGHETDTTLIDYAADLRAPTPTGAAEMAVPVRVNLLAQVLEDQQRLVSGMARMISEARHKLDARTRALADPRRLLETKAQQFDHLSEGLSRAFREMLSAKKMTLVTNASKLRSPQEIIRTAGAHLQRWSEQLAATAPKIMAESQRRVDHAGKMLEAYSFKNVLNRGFAVVKNAGGKLVTDPAQTKSGDTLHLLFKDDQALDVEVSKKS